MINIGCTVKNTFSFPFVENDVDKLYITYQQEGKTILEKELIDCKFEDNAISINLTQEETFKFKPNSMVKIQIRVKLKNEVVTKSNIVTTITDRVLKEGVI